MSDAGFKIHDRAKNTKLMTKLFKVAPGKGNEATIMLSKPLDQ